MAFPRSKSYKEIPEDLTPEDRGRARKKLWHQKNKARLLKQWQACNHEKSHKVFDGAGCDIIKTKVQVPANRRYAIIGAQAYFSTLTGFSVKELSGIIKEITAHVAERANISTVTAATAKKRSA
ncbi:MAG: hypothetical protein ACAI34_05670 [Verrucomicrobium sp.]